MVMRGFVPGTQVPQNNPNHVAEFRQVLVQRGRENDPDATLIMLAVVAPQQNQAVAFKGVSSRDSM
ncbi:MAG: hypothetical protein GY822_06355 [Deltaproteobacteria bacterium]|nr:hypothetical protein [Deltaproteobacteria bacterium]